MDKINGGNEYLFYILLEIYRKLVDSFLDAAWEGDTETVDRLLQDGMPVNMSNDYGCTALHSAALQNRIAVANRLMRAGADVNIQKYDGNTPLHLAAEFKSPDVARLLANRGANIKLKNTLIKHHLMSCVVRKLVVYSKNFNKV